MDAELFYVLVGAISVAAFARWRGWPAPLLVTVVALAVSFLPFVPELEIDGHVLLNLVLPPLLYSAALDVSFVGFKRSLPQIRRLGIWLVLITALVFHSLSPDGRRRALLTRGAIRNRGQGASNPAPQQREITYG